MPWRAGLCLRASLALFFLPAGSALFSQQRMCSLWSPKRVFRPTCGLGGEKGKTGNQHAPDEAMEEGRGSKRLNPARHRILSAHIIQTSNEASLR